MKITSKPKYICKHIGYLLLIIGFITLFIQISFGLSPLLSPIIFVLFVLSLIFQFIGWNEPTFLK